jgi:hypothetical protein
MYYEYKNYQEFDYKTRELKGQFYSPGTVARICQTSRQNVHNWIARDKIDAHRFKGEEGVFIFIAISELDKLGRFIDKQLKLY